MNQRGLLYATWTVVVGAVALIMAHGPATFAAILGYVLVVVGVGLAAWVFVHPKKEGDPNALHLSEAEVEKLRRVRDEEGLVTAVRQLRLQHASLSLTAATKKVRDL